MRTFLIAVSVPATLLLALTVWTLWQVPSDKEIKGCIVTTMARVKLCPGSKDYVPMGRISPFLQRAVVMAEDASFWTHQGFDWDSLEKSAWENWAKGRFKRGGSTISQQLAKNMFLTKDKTVIRKLFEALITMRIERVLSKKEILERYLNVVEFGKNIYGVKAAAQSYFQKAPADLTLVESIFLAIILPNPVKYSHSYTAKSLTPFARSRIERVLSDMARTGKISEEEHDLAKGEMEYFLGPEAPPTLEEGPELDFEPDDSEQEFDSVF